LRTPGFELEVLMVGRLRRPLPARLATATAATAAVSSATASAAATEVAATNRLRPRLVDDQRATVELILMQFVDRLLSVLIAHHFDECESARTPSGLVAHDANVIHCTGAAEQLRELFVRAFIREVANVQSAAHRCETLSRASADRNGDLSARERLNTGQSARN
jgi:hypothetical protein